MPDELDLISWIRKYTRPGAGVTCGVGDDCAALLGGEGQLLLTIDSVVEGVHFLFDEVRPQEVGWKALARSASDLAAMGCRPRAAC